MTEPERDQSLDPIVEILKEPATLRSDFTERVMTEIERLPVHRAPWWRRQWTIKMSPLRSAALAAGLAVVALGLGLVLRSSDSPQSPQGAGSTDAKLTQFVLVAPEASTVALVGDFNDWSLSATPLHRAEGDGVWYVAVPLVAGRYRYAFVVNGTNWRNDPEAPRAEDDFGRVSSVMTVAGS